MIRNTGADVMKRAFYFMGLIALSAPIPVSAFSLSIADGVGIEQSEPVRAKRKVIDKSCLMICEKWGENDCEKWVMKCKGDKGYPTGLLLSQ
jgi:hypothetical protein